LAADLDCIYINRTEFSFFFGSRKHGPALFSSNETEECIILEIAFDNFDLSHHMLQVGCLLSERFAKRGGSVEVDLSFVLQRLSSIEAGRRSFDSTVAGPENTAKIRAVTLGSNFTARIFCQVRFCRCKISGLELVFSVIDLDFRAIYQLIGRATASQFSHA